jgi:signal transduction histidine kinase
VVADAPQIEQVLQNLITHARDAIQGVGRVVVSAASVPLDADAAQRLGLPAAGDYAEVSVTDSGPALDREAQERLFDPSQSGPEAGRGAGLGLAIAVGIVELHGGAVRASSEPGRGTTIGFLLPQGDAARADPAEDGAAG